MADPAQIGTTGGAGVVGVLLGWLGFRSKICGLERSLRDLKQTVRYTDTCEALHEALDCQLTEIKANHKEIKNEIKRDIRDMRGEIREELRNLTTEVRGQRSGIGRDT